MIRKSFQLTYRFATALRSPVLGYPFEYTFSPEQFKFIDQRFEQYPVSQKLFPKQYEHIGYVLKLFQNYVNKGISEAATTQYVHKSLLAKAADFRSMLKQNSSKLQLNIDLSKCVQSSGYLQYYGYKPDLFIHQYAIQKKDQKVLLEEREQIKEKARKSAEQQLKLDIEQISKQKSIGSKMKDKLFKTKKQHVTRIFKIGDAFTQYYYQSLNAKKFKTYILVNKIKTQMNLVNFQGIKVNQDKCGVTTKWLYEVNSEQPEAIRKSRKRILYDFQLWNRGCFIPIFDFNT